MFAKPEVDSPLMTIHAHLPYGSFFPIYISISSPYMHALDVKEGMNTLHLINSFCEENARNAFSSNHLLKVLVLFLLICKDDRFLDSNISRDFTLRLHMSCFWPANGRYKQ